jgi:hypothetical protein
MVQRVPESHYAPFWLFFLDFAGRYGLSTMMGCGITGLPRVAIVMATWALPGSRCESAVEPAFRCRPA